MRARVGHINNREIERKALGFTLIECVVAMGIVAVMFPVMYVLIIQGSEASQKSASETRAVYAARTAMVELAMARNDVAEYLDEVPPWPAFPTSGDDYYFGMNEAGEIVSKLSASEGDASVTNPEITWVAKVRGESSSIETASGTQEISKVTIRIEYPARLPSAKRQAKIFHRLLAEHE